MKAVPRDAGGTGPSSGGIIRSAPASRRSANGKNGRAGDGLRKLNCPKGSNAIE
jgi:hypothetical protein